MALLTKVIEIDEDQYELENKIIAIVKSCPNIGLSDVVRKINDEDCQYSYLFQTALLNLISVGKVQLTLDRKLIPNT